MILDLGLIDYEECYKVQREFVRLRALGEIEDSLIIAEHPNVFTIGRSGSRGNLLIGEDAVKTLGAKVVYTDRGGDITFHGPGQIVLYPIIDLAKREKDLHLYMRELEDVAISFLRGYSVRGFRVEGRTGVWTEQGKIAFVGIAARSWIAYHGISININTDLRFFEMMNPCGMKDIAVTSLSGILLKNIDMNEASFKLKAYGLQLIAEKKGTHDRSEVAVSR